MGATPLPSSILKGHVFNLRRGKSANEILAIAGFDGRDEVWAIDTQKKTTRKIVAVLGGTNAFEARNEDLVVSSYRDGGYDIALARPVATVATTSGVSSPTYTGKSAATTETLPTPNDYTPWSTLFPRMWIPNLLIVPNGLQVGAYIPGFDIAQKQLYEVMGGYDTRGQPFALGDYTARLSNRFSIIGVANYLPSYIYVDQTFLISWGGSVGVDWEVASGWPHVKLNALFHRIEGSNLFGPANQGVGVSVGLSKEFAIRQRPLDISPYSGTRLSLTHSQYFQAMGSTEITSHRRQYRPICRGTLVEKPCLLYRPAWRLYRGNEPDQFLFRDRR